MNRIIWRNGWFDSIWSEWIDLSKFYTLFFIISFSFCSCLYCMACTCIWLVVAYGAAIAWKSHPRGLFVYTCGTCMWIRLDTHISKARRPPLQNPPQYLFKATEAFIVFKLPQLTDTHRMCTFLSYPGCGKSKHMTCLCITSSWDSIQVFFEGKFLFIF